MTKKIPIASRELGQDAPVIFARNVGIIKKNDLSSLVESIGGLAPKEWNDERLLTEVNSALTTYFIACRVAKRGQIYEFEAWCTRIASCTASTLKNLGLDQSCAPFSRAHGVAAGLFPPESYSIASGELRKHGLPEDPQKAVVLLANCLAFMQAHAARTAAFYAGRKGTLKPAFSPRQLMIADIGEVYEGLTGKRVPSRPNPDPKHTPFIRFALAIAKLGADRMVEPAEQPIFPQDGFDYDSALALRKLRPVQIAEDVHRTVWKELEKRREWRNEWERQWDFCGDMPDVGK